MAQVKLGTVVSNKMKGVVVVKVNYKFKHPLYKKQLTRSRKFKAVNVPGAEVGQKVKIIETRPVAKDVHFKVEEVLG